ncbi:TPA: hypothetical protein ACPPBN_001127 [Haemophilus influenzae]
MFPDIRKDDLTGFLALLAMLATSSKGFHSTSAPSNNFSKKVRLFFIVFLVGRISSAVVILIFFRRTEVRPTVVYFF